MSSRVKRLWLPLMSGGALFAVDLVTKEWAHRALWPANLPNSPRITVIPGCLDFLLAFNTGGAFSLFREKPWLITLAAAVATLGILIWCVLWCLRSAIDSIAARLAFGLILGGAAGNLVDRVRFQYVVDFIHAYVRFNGRVFEWPTFNIADCGIVIGIGMFLVLSLFTKTFDAVVEEPGVAGESKSAGAPEVSKASVHQAP